MQNAKWADDEKVVYSYIKINQPVNLWAIYIGVNRMGHNISVFAVINAIWHLYSKNRIKFDITARCVVVN